MEATGAWYDWTAGTKIIVVSRWRTREFNGSFCEPYPHWTSLGKRVQFPAGFLNLPNRAGVGLPIGSLFGSRGPPSELSQDQINVATTRQALPVVTVEEQMVRKKRKSTADRLYLDSAKGKEDNHEISKKKFS